MMQLFERQRLIRQKRRAALQRGVVAVLDIGTSKIVCMIIKFDPSVQEDAADGANVIARHNRFRVIGVATTRSRGIKYGEITAMAETERAVRTAVQAAQKMAGVVADHAFVCFSGGDPRSYGLSGETQLGTGEIENQDIANALASCDMPDLGEGREPLHAMPVNFAVDHRSGFADPRGQVGNKLAVDLHLLSVRSSMLQNLVACMKRCDLELAGVVASSYASAISALVEDEQELGAACVDLGAGATTLSVFYKKHMIYADSSPLAGGLVSNDISKGLQVPLPVAERIKTLHGGVMATGVDDRDMIDIGSDTGDWHHDRREISRSDLIGVMRPRLEEILEDVRERLKEANFDYLPGQRIVLTGGMSDLPGIDGLATRILGQQVRLGRPMRIQGLPQAATGPGFSAAVGLILYSAHPQDECWDFDLPEIGLQTRSLKRAFRWFRENW
ncbi:MAG: cell division protein FtsA [Pseudomonadota bacterium]